MDKGKIFITHTLEDLAVPVKYLLDNVKKQLENNGVIVFLNGPFESGKTAFIQELAYQVGVEDNVESPIFKMMNKYQIDSEYIPELYTLIHIDAYRLEPHHKETLRVEDFLKESGTLVCIEWPNAINLDKDLAYMHVDFEFMPHVENMRRIRIY